jgi:hypothetical protein
MISKFLATLTISLEFQEVKPLSDDVVQMVCGLQDAFPQDACFTRTVGFRECVHNHEVPYPPKKKKKFLDF